MLMRHAPSDPDTEIGGSRRRFPDTSYSAIAAARSENEQVRERGFETILANYWKPAYKYIRTKWNASNEDAKDLTQGFFAMAIEKNYFAGYDAEKASFQTYLRTCLDGFVANTEKSERRLKRGGGAQTLSLDFAGAEAELEIHQPGDPLSPEDQFYQEWIRGLFTRSVEVLRLKYAEKDRDVCFQIFEAYDLHDDLEPKPTYSDLAREYNLTPAEVNNYLAGARRAFRSIVLEKLREITVTEEEFRREARALLGVTVK